MLLDGLVLYREVELDSHAPAKFGIVDARMKIGQGRG